MFGLDTFFAKYNADREILRRGENNTVPYREILKYICRRVNYTLYATPQSSLVTIHKS